MLAPISQLSPPSRAPAGRAEMQDAAQKLETAFLASMLQSAGVGAPRDAFGGGTGEAQFTSFLVQAHAEAMVARGGVGLAEHLFRAMQARADA